MEANALPNDIGSKISSTLIENLDAANFCDHVHRHFTNVPPTRERVLDRLIVHKFEDYYTQIVEVISEKKHKARRIGDLFDVIPRGECLDLFLDLIKEHCMGTEQIKKFSQDIELLTLIFSTKAGIEWDRLYASNEYEICMTELFSTIFHRLTDRSVPIPALNTKLNDKYQAERINKLLRHMSKLWLNQHSDYSI
ncbi:hypothetical protein [Shewanella pealeana]|uniref:Uncharacterized protein n=1 Tax=Shewanella pealeana (strain ATCC 700345 / ANG-SQ1) TaxID=398579 RepID=A8H2Y4_SHEPA|nr:hypothetical protein [Shewanella pealeana]ABV86921.1 hypothetical protein Spea_1596 [Shewanella pealeana ATCC 700345]